MTTRHFIFAGLAAAAAAAAFTAGCATRHAPFAPQETAPFIQPTVVDDANVSEGSLWAGDDTWSLFTDEKASGPGDLVMVRVVEDSSAQKTVKTKIDRGASVNAGITNLMGQEARFGAGRLSDGNRKDMDLQNLVKAENSSSFKSDASVSQSGKVLANVMAQVIERRIDGNLRVFGSQVITINEEDQVVTISGLIRPTDIAPDNSIPSTLLADARILYSGRGPASVAGRPGWGLRLYYALWPF